jgi:hypothetical protein
MNSVCNIACGSEVGHQILKGSVKRFKSFNDLKKNPRWPPASGRHLGFLKIGTLRVIALARQK